MRTSSPSSALGLVLALGSGLLAVIGAAGCPGRSAEGEGEGGGAGEGEGEGEGEGPPPPPPVCAPSVPPDPDGTLTGTPFADLVITWPHDLDLCSAWTEGAPVAAERAKKTHVVIPVQPRPDFTRAGLAFAGLVGVRIERGVFAAERAESSVCPGTAVVGTWGIDDSAAPFVILRAENRYPFGGLGTVVETISVASQDGAAPAPVIYGDNSVVNFGFEDTTAGVSAFLSDCNDLGTSATSAYHALEVIVGSHGTEHAALVREIITQDTFAGSYPVLWQSSLLVRSDRPFEQARAAGFWAHTYAAQHHNWEEESVIDLDRDVVNWHAFFSDSPQQTSGTAPRTLRLHNIEGFQGAAGFDIVERDLASGDETTTTWDVTDPIRRVDATSLERSFLATCPTGRVQAVGVPGFDTYVVQALICPRSAAPGYVVTALVPVLFGEDPTVLGQTFGDISEVTVDGQPGFRATVGGAVVTLSDAPPGDMRLDVDTGSGFPTSTLAAPARLESLPGSEDTVQTFRSEDSAVEATIALRTLGQGAGISTLWAPVSTDLRLPEQRFFTDALDTQRYTSTHHNWYDSLDSTVGDVVVHWSVAADLSGTADFLKYTVSADRGATELLPPTPVSLVP